MGNKGVLIVRTDISPAEIETDWNSWYDNEHIPARLAIPGFNAARRFVQIEGEYKHIDPSLAGSKYLILYDLASTDVLISEAYLQLREREGSNPPNSFEVVTANIPGLFRGVYEQIYPDKEKEYKPPNTSFILAVGHDVPSDREEEFNAWYATDHIPGWEQVPGVVTARRFIAAKAQVGMRENVSLSPKYITLYDLESEQVLHSDAGLRAHNSPWSIWMRRWFIRRFLFIGRRIYPKPCNH